jgi:hypothetical protein
MFSSPLPPVLAILAATSLAACSNNAPWLPIRSAPTPSTETTLLWVGRGECESLQDGKWVRRPSFDSEFSVEQRRSGARWESVKSLRRLHPEYDGSAGERAQTYFFTVDYRPPTRDGGVRGQVQSSLGRDVVETDRDFREATIELDAAVSSFAPFDRYRITQHYRYEAGALEELVELNDGRVPWVRNHERATLYKAGRFDTPPTRYEARD